MITDQDGVKTIFADLTEEQWERGVSWLQDQPITHEVWEDDHSKIILHSATVEQANKFAVKLQGNAR